MGHNFAVQIAFEREAMKTKLIGAISPLALGILIAVAPFTFAPVCMGEPGDYMPCHWTAQASLGIGVVIALLGLITLFIAPKVRAGLSIAVVLVAALEIAIVTKLIGVCGMAMMHCHSLTRPTLLVLSVLAIVISAVVAYLDLRNGAETK